MTISAEQVSAVLVTRGDVDLSRILASIADAGVADVVIWNNAEREDLKTYGRYAALPEAAHDVIYFQDDDIFLPPTTILGIIEAYEPGVICANMSARWVAGRDLVDSVFVGAGAVLDKDIPGKAFERYLRLYDRDEIFYYYPEALVSIPSKIKRVDLPLEVLPWGYAPNRMNAQPWFERRMKESIARGRRVRDECPL